MPAEAVYWGEREAMVAEVSAFDPVSNGVTSARKAKYLVMPYGDEQFETAYFSSKEAAKNAARDDAVWFGVSVRHVT